MKLKDDLNWTTIEGSSQIDALAHDDDGLYVRFHNTSVYGYPNVPVAIFEQMKVAESVGKFLNAQIKPSYSYERLV